MPSRRTEEQKGKSSAERRTQYTNKHIAAAAIAGAAIGAAAMHAMHTRKNGHSRRRE